MGRNVLVTDGGVYCFLLTSSHWELTEWQSQLHYSVTDDDGSVTYTAIIMIMQSLQSVAIPMVSAGPSGARLM